MARGQLLGTLSFGSREHHALPEDTLPLLGIVSHYMAAAIERQRGADTLVTRAKQWHALAESVPHLVWTCLPDGRCDYLSRQSVKYTGRTGGSAARPWMAQACAC